MKGKKGDAAGNHNSNGHDSEYMGSVGAQKKGTAATACRREFAPKGESQGGLLCNPRATPQVKAETILAL